MCSYYYDIILLARLCVCVCVSFVVFCQSKGEGEGHPITGHEGPEGEQMYSSTLPSTSALDGVGGQHHAAAALPPGKTRYPLYRRLGGPQGRSARVQKILPSTGIRSPDLPARSESLYQLSYRGLCSIVRVADQKARSIICHIFSFTAFEVLCLK